MVYAVSRYQDSIKVKKVREPDGLLKKFEWFDTEEEAKTYIRNRALELFRQAEINLSNAATRGRRVEKKFSAKK